MVEEGSFKVTDRRGRSQEEPLVSEAPIPLGTPGSLPPERKAGDSRVEPAASAGGGRGAPAARGESGDRGGLDLGSLFMMFGSAALVGLGEAVDPASGTRRVDLAQAQEGIDILLLLRDKTEGNRSEEESQLLEDLLYDLELRFVRAANHLGAPSS
jgi:Domain of unknown function (DUF1844)